MAGTRKALLVGVDPTNFVTAVGGGTYSGSVDKIYEVEVTTPGASGTAKVTVRVAGVTVNAATAVTSGAAITLGSESATLTLTWTGDLLQGMKWYVHACESSNAATYVDQPDMANFASLRPVVVNSAGEMMAKLTTDAMYTDGSGTPSKGLLVMGTDGTNPQALKVTADGAQAVKGDAPAAVTSTIAAEGTTSPDWLDVRGYTPLFGTDTAFAGTDITFLHSFNGSDSAGPLKDGDGNAVTLTGAATTLQTIVPTGNDAIALAAAFYVKIVKTTAQGAGTPTVITVGKSA